MIQFVDDKLKVDCANRSRGERRLQFEIGRMDRIKGYCWVKRKKKKTLNKIFVYISHFPFSAKKLCIFYRNLEILFNDEIF